MSVETLIMSAKGRLSRAEQRISKIIVADLKTGLVVFSRYDARDISLPKGKEAKLLEAIFPTPPSFVKRAYMKNDGQGGFLEESFIKFYGNRQLGYRSQFEIAIMNPEQIDGKVARRDYFSIYQSIVGRTVALDHEDRINRRSLVLNYGEQGDLEFLFVNPFSVNYEGEGYQMGDENEPNPRLFKDTWFPRPRKWDAYDEDNLSHYTFDTADLEHLKITARNSQLASTIIVPLSFNPSGIINKVSSDLFDNPHAENPDLDKSWRGFDFLKEFGVQWQAIR